MPAALLNLAEHVLVSNLLTGLVEVNHGAADVEEVIISLRSSGTTSPKLGIIAAAIT
jgi:hypothetical protein